MTVAVDPRIGSELAGYRIEALLGRGGMSDVYLAQDLRLKRRVALKLLAPDLARDERFRERFLRESELAASLDHANVIPIFEAGEVDGVLYIAMRYVEGSDLKSVLAAEGLLEPARALALLDQVAAALDAAHEHGLVHRDVKPGNILVAAAQGREHVYLSDFGLTKRTAEEAGLTESGQFFGTAEYVAPEQIEGGQVDGRADLYSLGCVLYECLVGEPPFGGDRKVGLLFAHLQKPPPSPTQQRPELPAGIDAVIAKAMAKEPEQRYPSCGELAEAAHGVLAGAAPAALPAALAGPAPPLVGREEELGWLRRAWTAAQEGSGALLVLSGPRGIGKTRLAAELAREASADRAAVRYATCVGSDGAAATLSGAVQANGPTLLVLEDLDAADATLLEALESIADEIDDQPLLVVGTYRRAAAMPELERLVALLSADRVRELGPLTADGARQIAALHAGADADAFPVEPALEATEGVPLRLHEVASEWARAEASRRLGSAAEHAAAERSSLREAEAAVAENVVGLQLIEERARLYSPVPLAGPETRDVCPFKGLASFEAADADYFFGRERLVAELVARLVGAGFLGIVGPSGSGKSSLLRAGLLPALAAGVLPGSERWRRVLIRPGEHPLEELGRALGSDHGDPVAAAIGSLAPGERLILAIDQFEELFTACSSEQERTDFAETLVAAAADPEQRAVVIVAARADFYGRCAAYPALAELLGANHVLVGPMQAEELRRAIELPAARAGLQVEPELVEALVSDVEHEPGGLPLLSTSLLELWQKRTDNRLELATYQESGGVHGAVARLAEDAYGRLSETERPLARSILLRLAGEGEGDTVVRRRAPLAELDVERDEDRARVLAVLTERRLVTVSEGTVEVAHEALLREWPRLREWIQEDSQGRSLRRHLTQSASEWDAAGRDDGELYRGPRLAAALDWTADHDSELNELERAFVTESRDASEQETRRVRRTNRRLRGLLIGVAILLAAAIAGGIFAVVQRGQARDAADKAEASAAQARNSETAQLAQRLGAQALVEDDLDLSLLLARQAVAIDDSVETRSNLLADLLRSPAAIGIVYPDPTATGIVYPEGDELSAAVSPDGGVLAVAGSSVSALFRSSVSALFFDARSLERLGDPVRLPGDARALTFSPDGRTLAVAGETLSDAYLSLLDAATREIRADIRFVVAAAGIGRVAYSPDGRLLAVAEQAPPAGDWRLVLRDPTTGEQSGPPINAGSGQLDFAFSPDGRFVVTSNQGGSVALVQWDLETRRAMRTFEGTGGSVAVSPDGRTAAIGRGDGTVGLVDLRSGRARPISGRHGAAVTSPAFSPDGKTLATASADGTVILWDVASGVPRETLRGHADAVQQAVFSPTGETLYTASQDGTTIAWDLAGHRRLGRAFAFTEDPTIEGRHPGRFGPDGKLIAVSLYERGIGLRNAVDLEPVGRALEPTGGEVSMIDFSRDGKTLAAVTLDAKATIWDVESRSLLHGPWDAMRPGGVPGVSVSPDGTRLAVSGAEGVTLWNIATGASLGQLGDAPLAADTAFDSAGELVAFGLGTQRRAEVWDVARRTRIVAVTAGDGAYVIAFSHDGQTLATAGFGQTVSLWDALTGEFIRELDQRGSGKTTSMVFSPDGNTLAVSGSRGNVSLWDLGTGTQVGRLEGGSTGRPAGLLYTSTDFSPDGKRLLMTMGDGRGIVWDVDPESWARRACQIANRTLTQEEWEQFLPGRPYEPACAEG